jgi:Na+-transporting NADH:ubiquinone oxidoreductase subunit C
MSKESMKQTVGVALAVCAACSIMVSTSAVALKQRQEDNRILDRKKNILVAAGVMESGEKLSMDEVDTRYAQIEGIVIDVETGETVLDDEGNPLDPDSIDWKEVAGDPKQSVELSSGRDTARIRRRANIQPVYLLRNEAGQIERVILPVRGKGLWSTMRGFLALEGDLNSIGCLTFYEHGETPGLGGEIDNEKWKQQWTTKLAFNEKGAPVAGVAKGKARDDDPYQVDGLSGATLTSNGVTELVQFWLGKDGYGTYITKLRLEAETNNE